MSETCSYCGENGHSIQSCPKWKHHSSPERPQPISSALLDFFSAFETDLRGDTWVDLYVEASATLHKVFGRVTGEHLWAKFRDDGLLKMWRALDHDNREIVQTMLNIWVSRSGAIF